MVVAHIGLDQGTAWYTNNWLIFIMNSFCHSYFSFERINISLKLTSKRKLLGFNKCCYCPYQQTQQPQPEMPLRRDCTQLTCASSASAWLARRPANRRRACGRKRSGCQRGLNQSLHPHAHARAQFSPAGPEGQNRLPEVVVLAERLVVEGPGAEQRLAARKDDSVQRLAPHHAGFVLRSRLALQTQAAAYRTGPSKSTDTRNVEPPQ